MTDPLTSVQYLKGAGPARARLLAKLGVQTVADLVHHYPREHQDRRQMTAVGDLRPETTATVRARTASVRAREVGGRARGRRKSVVVPLSVTSA